jgi:hypothetical protein
MAKTKTMTKTQWRDLSEDDILQMSKVTCRRMLLRGADHEQIKSVLRKGYGLTIADVDYLIAQTKVTRNDYAKKRA